MSAPTPGPWFAHSAGVYSADPNREKPGTPMDHALVACCGDDGDEFACREQAANARLIAAAPDMLANAQAIEDASDWLYSLAEDQTCSDLCDKTYEFQGCPSGTCARETGLASLRKLFADNRAAIAKATGAQS